ncbi:MAG: hypothetical protein PHN69_03080 [Candidatus Pacebacteria bacterium]|nr:hypothetical protein [Candidatus Paceibacterota bacterium]
MTLTDKLGRPIYETDEFGNWVYRKFDEAGNVVLRKNSQGVEDSE